MRAARYVKTVLPSLMMSFALTFPQRRDTAGIGEELEMEDAAAELFAEAQARAREQAAYEQLKASGM